MENTRTKPTYIAHAGTVRISGKSGPLQAAKYVAHLLTQGTTPVDILFIGANAGQQAFKTCEIAASLLDKHQNIILTFQPLRFMTNSAERDVLGRTVLHDGVESLVLKDAFVWRVCSTEKNICISPAQ